MEVQRAHTEWQTVGTILWSVVLGIVGFMSLLTALLSEPTVKLQTVFVQLVVMVLLMLVGAIVGGFTGWLADRCSSLARPIVGLLWFAAGTLIVVFANWNELNTFLGSV